MWGLHRKKSPARNSAECSPLPSGLSLNILGVGVGVGVGVRVGVFGLGKLTAETKAWLRVPELWMACWVPEVCGEHTCALI